MNSYLFWSQIIELKAGTAQPNVNAEKLKTLLIPHCLPVFQNQIISETEADWNADGDTVISRLLRKSSRLFDNLKGIETELTHQRALLTRLRQSILQDAVQGRLTAQWRQAHPNQEPASELLRRIREAKAATGKKEKPLPPVREEEMPFELPEGWVWSRLGEISSKIGSGSTPSGGKEVYVKDGIKFFRSQNIYSDGIRLDDIVYIDRSTHDLMSGTKVEKSDILLNITGGSIGRAALVPANFDEGNVSQHVCIIRPLMLNNSFLHLFINSPYFRKLIFESTTGAGREGLPKYNLEKFPVPLPPLSEQAAIVARVEALLERVSALEAESARQRVWAEGLLQAALREAMGG